MIEIELPDGSIAEFPDGTPEGKILSAVKQLHMRQTVEKNVEDVARNAAARTGPTEDEQRKAMFSPENRARAEAIRQEGEAAGAGMAIKYAPLAIAAGTSAPVVLAKGLVGGAVGAGVGEYAGGKVGGFVGAPEAGRHIGGTLGGLLGGLYASGVPLPGAIEAGVAQRVPSWLVKLAGRGTAAESAPVVAATAPAIPAGASSSGGYSFAGVPNLSNVTTPSVAPATVRAALEAIPEAGGGELAAILAKTPQLAAKAAPTVAAPAAASVAPAVMAPEAPALAASVTPKAVFDLAFKQAVAAGKSVPEAATIARAARMQSGLGKTAELAETLQMTPGAAPLPPTGLNAAHTAELAAIAEKPLGFTPSRPPPPATPGWTPPLRDPAFLEQSSLLAKLLEQGATPVVKAVKRRRRAS